jgi:hypothetical protein
MEKDVQKSSVKTLDDELESFHQEKFRKKYDVSKAVKLGYDLTFQPVNSEVSLIFWGNFPPKVGQQTGLMILNESIKLMASILG